MFLYFFLPEMRGRSLEEIDELFQNRVPRREFPNYHCLSGERAHEQALKNAGIAEAEAEKKMEVERREVAV